MTFNIYLYAGKDNDEKRLCSNKNVKRIVGESSQKHNEVNSREKVC